MVIYGSTSTKAYRHWVSCERNYYSFSFVLLKLYRCLCQGLKMCMMFGCNPQINFCHFSHSLNLVIFGSTSTKAYRHWVSCERNYYSFSFVLLKLYRCLCQGLKMCMMFGCNPQINFCHFSHSLNLVIFESTSTKAYRHWVSCERNYYSFSFVLLKLYRCLCQGLKMCMMFGCNPQINFCHFFRSLNLVIFIPRH